jgi:TonB family protein
MNMTEAWKQYEGQIVDGKFPLRECLGGSSGSAVFLTELAPGLPEKAAIKLLVADPRDADAQMSRWKFAAKLAHQNLLKLYDSGRARLGETEFLYAVIELAEEDVSQILPHRALTSDETRDMLPPVLAALGYLHAKGFVHAHVKPANISAVGDHIKISIDGIRRAGEANLGIHASSPYDAPEAASEKASPEADVWSLGMTLVEVLTQQLIPWERMGQKDPQVREELPAPLLDIVRNCLRRDPPSRLTIQGITARLSAASPVLAAPRTPQPPRLQEITPVAKTQMRPSKSGLQTLAIGVAVALALIFGIAKLVRHEANIPADPAPAPAAEPASETVKPKPEPASHRVETKAAPPKISDEPTRVAAKTEAPAAATKPAPTVKPAAEMARAEDLHQVLPNVSQSARDTISGTVKVSVKLSADAAGKVSEASLEAPGPSKYFANLALKAAQGWTFSPAIANGQPAPSDWRIRFEFTHDGVKAFPTQSPEN